MTSKKTFYVTTPIYYVNSSPHIGSAYTTIAADVLARWNRLLGKEVFFLTGTDEHGKKIQEVAKERKLSPREFVDKISLEFKEAFKLLNITNDNFIRTTDKYHEEEVKKILQELYDKKFIYKGVYESCYCVGCEQYLSKSELVDGKCPLHPNQDIEAKKEEAYLFKLSKFQKELVKAIKTGEFAILPEKRKNEILSFIASGLQDISISRKKSEVPWGIELPFDKNHTCYVWVDAFWNYISGLKTPENKKKFWPANIQLMANDISRVHGTIWPAILLALKLKLPKKMFVHGFFTVNGQKMSKSLGNVINPVHLAKTYGSDSVKYYMLRAISFGEDGDFDESALIARHNNELADKLGNLVSRVSTLTEKYGLEKTKQAGPLESAKLLKATTEHLENLQFDKALNEIFAYIDKCNEHVQKTKPWETKDKKVLYQLASAIKDAAILLSPFMPETCDKIAKTFSFDINLKEVNKPLEVSKVKKSAILFKKIAVAESLPMKLTVQTPTIKIVNNKKPEQPKIEGVATMGDLIKYDDFAKLDLRIATIKKVEDIEGADKLYNLEVQIGKENRTILAGIKEHYTKDELKGKQIVVICNLEPRKMKGCVSEGMLLAAVSNDGKKVILLNPEKTIESGSKVQ